jgi:transcriptional regulator with XRE-family HTH domain
MMRTHEHIQEHELGNLLRYWRHQRGKSQFNLSLDTGISQRHLSFVESGRSVPSRDLLSIVSEKLDIPLRERNVLLLASGYAPIYEESSWDVPEMAAVTKAIDRLLLQQEPHPALVLDRYWNVSDRAIHLFKRTESVLKCGYGSADERSPGKTTDKARDSADCVGICNERHATE